MSAKRAAMEGEGPADKQGPGTGFDARLARLEALVAELENGGLALETSIERYQEGVVILRECRALLTGFQRRVEELSASGAIVPHAADPDAERA
jgi:exodeoxyribonuclease VII small subunit